MNMLDQRFRIHKSELIAHLGYTKWTFQRQIKILCSDKSTPFTYEEFKKCGHYIKKQWANYILNNI